MIKILEEDDCAPDAREYFAKDFYAKVGMLLSDFQRNAIAYTSVTGIEWYKKPYYLRFSADDPFYTLYMEEDNG